MERVRACMLQIFGFNDFKNAAQQEAIESIFGAKKNNFFINMAVRGGKSLCYQLPGAMKTSGVTIVIVPSLALMYNHLHYLRSRNIEAECINSATEYADRDVIIDNLTANDSTIRFLFLTPEMAATERISDLISDLINENSVNYFVVDEAHKVIDASEYRQAFSDLRDFRTNYQDLIWIALTTASESAQLEIAHSLNMNDVCFIKASSVIGNIFYDVIRDDRNILDFIGDLNNGEEDLPPGIVFCGTINRSAAFLNILRGERIEAAIYNGGLPNGQEVIENWCRGDFQILIATGESFGYGLNFNMPMIRFVIHYCSPLNLRSFYHESGRAGNDGNLSYSRIYLGPNEGNSIETYLNGACRRQSLARFFGEEIERCGNMCDQCAE